MRHLALLIMLALPVLPALPGVGMAQNSTTANDVAADVLNRLQGSQKPSPTTGGAPTAPSTEAPEKTLTEAQTAAQTGPQTAPAPADATPAVPAVPADSTLPVLTVEMKDTTAIPGQPLTLRLTVLVPTWLPKPVVFPSFEVPNLLIRLPEKSTGPTSQRIDGATWSGITRLYRFYPMIDGVFSIPPQDLLVTYADPETSDPVQVTLATPALEFAGQRPEGTQDLDPFLAANALTLDSSVTGDPAALSPGDAFTRQITVTLQGTSPIFLPPLLDSATLPGLAAYPAEPMVSEKEDRSVLSGTRQENITYVAEAGLSGALSAVDLRWYNLKTGTVETASIPALTVFADGPPPAEITPPRDLRRIALISTVFALALGLLTLVLRGAAPRLKALKNRRRAAYLASEPYAFAQVTVALKAKDYGTASVAIRQWRRHAPVLTPTQHAQLDAALIAISKARYSATGDVKTKNNWSALGQALTLIRTDQTNTAKHLSKSPGLPPLNPRTP